MHHGQNASKGKELIKLKNNIGTRANIYKLAMCEFRQKTEGIFLAIWAPEICSSLPSVMGLEIVKLLGGKKDGDSLNI